MDIWVGCVCVCVCVDLLKRSKTCTRPLSQVVLLLPGILLLIIILVYISARPDELHYVFLQWVFLFLSFFSTAGGQGLQ